MAATIVTERELISENRVVVCRNESRHASTLIPPPWLLDNLQILNNTRISSSQSDGFKITFEKNTESISAKYLNSRQIIKSNHLQHDVYYRRHHV